MAHKRLFLTLTLIVTSTIICQDYDEQPIIRQEQEENKTVEPKQEISAFAYYSAHLTTALAAKLVALGLVVAVRSHWKYENDLIKISFNTAKEVSHMDICAFLLGSYILYKTPQWTDDAIGIEEKRSFLGNVFSFVTRDLIPFPVGSLASEFVIRQDS